jgi:hypothetical protein
MVSSTLTVIDDFLAEVIPFGEELELVGGELPSLMIEI